MKNQSGKAISDQAGESDLSETFTRNIGRNEDNMRRGAHEYGDVFEKMTQINQWTVRHALNEADPAPDMAPVRRAVAADYDAYTAHGTRPTVESMLPRCQALGYDWKDH
jgi:hypothetical protein